MHLTSRPCHRLHPVLFRHMSACDADRSPLPVAPLSFEREPVRFHHPEEIAVPHASIKSQVAEFNEGFDAQIGPDLARTFAREQEALRSAGVPATVVSVGDVLPEATLLTAASEEVRLSDA